MLDELIARIRELTGAENVCEADDLRSVGVDSLTYVQLIVEAEQKYTITFDDEQLVMDEIGTVGALARIMEEKCKKEHCTE